jgi:hypothetical protein
MNFDLKSLPNQLGRVGHKVLRFLPITFFLVLAGVYGFMLLRITMLSNAQPTDAQISDRASSLSQHIDKRAVSQLESLEDNSVNVQALFQTARDNPFNE